VTRATSVKESWARGVPSGYGQTPKVRALRLWISKTELHDEREILIYLPSPGQPAHLSRPVVQAEATMVMRQTPVGNEDE
jgi:hypothetical protein